MRTRAFLFIGIISIFVTLYTKEPWFLPLTGLSFFLFIKLSIEVKKVYEEGKKLTNMIETTIYLLSQRSLLRKKYKTYISIYIIYVTAMFLYMIYLTYSYFN